MSHFTCLVVVRGADDATSAESQLDNLLEPFNENRSVPEYVDWSTEAEVDRTVAFYRKHPEFCDGEQGPAKPFDEYVTEGNLEAWREWTRQAVGASDAGDPDKGVVEGDRFGSLSSYNPNSKWDWWQVGGRWNGYLKLKDTAAVGSTTVGAPGVFGDDMASHEGRADLARKGDVDLDGMRDEAEKRAIEAYDKFAEATKDIEVPPTFKEMAREAYFDANIDPDGWMDFMPDADIEERRTKFNAPLDAARKRFHATPWAKALKENDLLGFFGDPHDDWCVFESNPRDAFIQRARDRAVSFFAVLLDGEWYEKGKMGWFGSVSSEKDEAMWLREQARLIDSLPDDAYLAVVDCHI